MLKSRVSRIGRGMTPAAKRNHDARCPAEAATCLVSQSEINRRTRASIGEVQRSFELVSTHGNEDDGQYSQDSDTT